MDITKEFLDILRTSGVKVFKQGDVTIEFGETPVEVDAVEPIIDKRTPKQKLGIKGFDRYGT